MTLQPRPTLLERARAAVLSGADDGLLAELEQAAATDDPDPELLQHLAVQLLRRGRPAAAARWFLKAPLDLKLGDVFVLARAQALITARHHDAVEQLAETLAGAERYRPFTRGLRAQVALAEDRLHAALELVQHGRAQTPQEFHFALLEAQCLARLGREDELRVLVGNMVATARAFQHPQLEQHVWTIVRQAEFTGRTSAKDRVYVREGVVLLGTTSDDGERVEMMADARLDVRAIARSVFRFHRLQQALEWPLLSLEAGSAGGHLLAEAMGEALEVPVRRPAPGQPTESAWWVQDLADERHPLPPPTARPRFVLAVAGEPPGETALPEVTGILTVGPVSLPWDRAARANPSPLSVHLAPGAVRSERELSPAEFKEAFRDAFRKMVPEPADPAQVDYYLRRHRHLRPRIEPRAPKSAAAPQADHHPLALLAEDEPVPLLGALRHLWKQKSLSPPVGERLQRLFQRDPQLRPAVLPLLERFLPDRALELVQGLGEEPEAPGPTRGDFLAALRTTAVLPALREDLRRHPMVARVGTPFPDFRLGAFLHREELIEVLDEVAAAPGGLPTVLAFAAGIPRREAPQLEARITAWARQGLAPGAPPECQGAALAACLAGWTALQDEEAARLLEPADEELRNRALQALARGQAPAVLARARDAVRDGTLPWCAGAARVLLTAPADHAAFVAGATRHGLPPLHAGEDGYLAALGSDGERDRLLSAFDRDPAHDHLVTQLLLPLLAAQPVSELLIRWLPRTAPHLPPDAAAAVVRTLLLRGCGSAEENALLRGILQLPGTARYEAAALLLARGDQRFRETLALRPPGTPPEEGPGPECLAYLPATEIDALGESLLLPMEQRGGELLTQRVLATFADRGPFPQRLLDTVARSGFQARFLDHLAAFYLAEEAPPFPEGMVATFGLRDGMESPSLRVFFRLDPALGQRAARQRFAHTTSLEREVILRTVWSFDRALYDELAAQLPWGQDRVLDCLRRSLALGGPR